MERPQKTNYFEFDFQGYNLELADKAGQINEEIEDEDDRYQAVDALIQDALCQLDVQGVIGSEVIIHQGARIAEVGEEGLQMSTTQEPIVGQYTGLALATESLDEKLDYRRFEIAHRILIERRAVSNGLIEYSLARYALLAIDRPGIELIQAPVAHSPNEEWLNQVFNPVQKAPSIDPALLARTFERIQTAKQSQDSREKHADWYIDRLNEHFKSVGRELVVCSQQGLRHLDPEDGGGYFDESDPVLVQGKSLGFCVMPKYESNESSQHVPTDELQLGFCVEVTTDDDTYLAKLPVASLSSIQIINS